MSRKLPNNVSQLDYLWTTFGDYEIGADGIITAPILQEFLKEYTKGGIVDIEIVPKSENTLELVLHIYGGETKTLEIDKEDHLVNVESILSTIEEVNNNICDEINLPLIVFTMLSGKKYYVQQPHYTGVQTNSIMTAVANNKIASHLILDRTSDDVVDLNITQNGLKVKLSINPDRDNLLTKTNEGLTANLYWDE